jgi:hypothetical protein
MATFKVGDRVRIKDSPGIDPKYRGVETIITGPSFTHWYVKGPCWPVACYAFGAAEEVLIPLTPPASDAWATEAVRRVTKPLHTEPVAPKVTA